MIRRPPRSTPFPTRRSSDLRARDRGAGDRRPARGTTGSIAGRVQGRLRSEEHTSELQSQSNLVCRLLLEKKKKKKNKTVDNASKNMARDRNLYVLAQ